MILENLAQNIILKKRVYTVLGLEDNIMKKYIYLMEKLIKILISLVQEPIQQKCIQWEQREKDTEFILGREMHKVNQFYKFTISFIDPVLMK